MLSTQLLLEFTVHHDPVSAPRMTRADVWKKRPCVMKYRAFADAIREAYQAQGIGTELGVCNSIAIDFYLPIPPSTPSGKRRKMQGAFHNVRPDIDNLIKGVLDALFEKDSSIYEVYARKFFASEIGAPRSEIHLFRNNDELSGNVDAL